MSVLERLPKVMLVLEMKEGYSTVVVSSQLLNVSADEVLAIGHLPANVNDYGLEVKSEELREVLAPRPLDATSPRVVVFWLEVICQE